DTIRASHLERLHAGDIGYHFVIDRDGRLWEGRSLKYQGAHVKDNNEHNIGIMTLGNFDLQSPTSAQLTTLKHTVSTLARQYNAPPTHTYTHQEITPTRSPAPTLQPRTAAMRSTGDFACPFITDPSTSPTSQPPPPPPPLLSASPAASSAPPPLAEPLPPA